MATNNATNRPNPISVAKGGTGVASTTSYAVLCGGTTSTNPLQSIAGVGSSGDILTSNGAGALPTFQTPNTGLGYMIALKAQTSNMADAQTYFISQFNLTTFTASGSATTQLYIPKAGTITKVYGVFNVAGTLASNENVTLAIRVNNTTDINISTTLQLTSAETTFNNTGLSTAVSAGDYIEYKIVTPTWGTNPTSVSFSASVYIV